MIISLDTSSSIPIYVQLRNQIVLGIGRGELKPGEGLPTVRQMAKDAGINTMTVNKTYQILKAEGFIEIDRRSGAFVSRSQRMDKDFEEKLESDLTLLMAEASVKGMDKEDFLKLCERVFASLDPCQEL